MNEKKMVGKRSVLFSRPPIIIGAGSVAGEKEGNGAFGKCFDMVEEDPLFGGKTWEEAESKMQQLATRIALRKAGLEPQEIRYLVAGDLLGQLIATSFGIMNFNMVHVQRWESLWRLERCSLMESLPIMWSH